MRLETEDQIGVIGDLGRDALGAEHAGIDVRMGKQRGAVGVDRMPGQSARAGAVRHDIRVGNEPWQQQFAHGGAADITGTDEEDTHTPHDRRGGVRKTAPRYPRSGLYGLLGYAVNRMDSASAGLAGGEHGVAGGGEQHHGHGVRSHGGTGLGHGVGRGGAGAGAGTGGRHGGAGGHGLAGGHVGGGRGDHGAGGDALLEDVLHGQGALGVGLERTGDDLDDVGHHVVVSGHGHITVRGQAREREGHGVAFDGTGGAVRISHGGVGGEAEAEHGGDGGKQGHDLLLHM